MDDEGGNKGVWIGLVVAILAAVLFGALWFMRGGEIGRMNSAMRAAESSASSEARRLESDVRSARSEADSANRKIAELETRLREDVRRAGDSAAQTERQLRSDLDAATRNLGSVRGDLERAQAESGELRKQVEALTGELAQARGEAEERKTSADSERVRLSADLDGTRTAMKELETKLSASQTSLDAAQADLKTAREEMLKASASTEAADLRAELAAATAELDNIRNASADMEKARARLESELAQERETAKTRESALRQTIDELSARQDAAPTAVATGAPVAVAAVQNASMDHMQLAEQLRKENEELRTARESALAMARDAREKLTETEKLLAQANADEAALRVRIEELEKTTAEKIAAVNTDAPAAVAAAQSDDKDHGFADAGRTVGRIVEKMADGQTLLITGGVNGHVKVGMKFDVYRRSGERNRYIGAIRVTRVMDDFSMAVPAEAEGSIMICPVTGRAVLEPGARYSPYVLSKDGKPVELVSADSLGLVGETPDKGDSIDNPFYDPERRMIFAVPPELAADYCVFMAVEALGGVARSGSVPPADADYLLVKDGSVLAGAVPAGGSKRVTPEHLANYLEPRPVFR